MIDFLKYRAFAGLYSLMLVALFVSMYAYKTSKFGSAFSYSVDFTGGTQVLFKFDKPVSPYTIKEVLEANGWSGAETREFSSTEVLVRVKEFSGDVKGFAVKMQQALESGLPETKAYILENEAVGPAVGATLRKDSTWAVLIALLAMLAYIAIRFWSTGFAVGAVVALAHDSLVMLLIFLLFNREISVNVIGAILAVLGYSVNDTIVIFAKIRENLKTMRGHTLDYIVNTSINQTLRRTLLTSFATLLTVVALFILGGEALRDLSLVLLVGIIFGTYSSIYIASPVMMLLYKK